MKRKIYALFLVLELAATLAIVQQAKAVLGGSADSIASDQKVLSAVRRTTKAHSGYNVHEAMTASITVREYVSPSGVVFGIAWNGLTHPDMTPLLGSYADEYGEALQQTPRKQGRRHIQVKTNQVVVEKWGHMRNLKGRAYAPALIPTGVSVDEIK